MANAPTPTPSRAVYGFVFHLSFKILFIIYMIWAVIPEEWFTCIGITYLPKRYWAITIPIYLLTILTIFAFIIYPSLGLIMTPHIDSIHTISDQNSLTLTKLEIVYDEGAKVVQCCQDVSKCKKDEFFRTIDKFFMDKSIPQISDLNISDVCKTLYLET